MKLGIITDCAAGLQLAVSFMEKQMKVAVCKLNTAKGQDSAYMEFVKKNSDGTGDFLFDIEALLLSLKPPRVLTLICDCFSADDLKLLSEKLTSGDTIIDCCDMSFKESARNAKILARGGVNYMGTGFVYSAVGIIKQPSFLISGDKAVYNNIQRRFATISPVLEGRSCAAYVGPDGVGQYIKMVHNGIYYAFLELIAELIYVLRVSIKLEPELLSDLLISFGAGELRGFLLDVAADVVKRKDSYSDNYLIDLTLDRMNTTLPGRWIAKSALELSCPIPMLTTAIDVRFISNLISERIASSRIIGDIAVRPIPFVEQKQFFERCRRTLYVGLICALAQGFSLLRKASDAYHWNLDLFTIACALQGGTFIQSDLLYRVMAAYKDSPNIENILMHDYFSGIFNEYDTDVRETVSFCVAQGLPVPAMISILQYIDCYRCTRLPTTTIQLMRDCVTGSGFERLDGQGLFFGNWENPTEIVTQKSGK